MKNNAHRLFFALAMDDTCKQQISEIISALQHHQDNTYLHWTPSDNLHVTIKFIGETDILKTPDILDAVKNSIQIQHISPFHIKTTQLIPLPSLRHPRLLALGVDRSPPLENLYRCIEHALAALGIPKEKHSFIPHITLARSQHHLQVIYKLLQQPDTLSVFEQKVTHLTLYHSERLATGSTYVPIDRIFL